MLVHSRRWPPDFRSRSAQTKRADVRYYLVPSGNKCNKHELDILGPSKSFCSRYGLAALSFVTLSVRYRLAIISCSSLLPLAWKLNATRACSLRVLGSFPAASFATMFSKLALQKQVEHAKTSERQTDYGVD